MKAGRGSADVVGHHPIQPIETDANGVRRFKRNRIVDAIAGKIGLNGIHAIGSFTADDWDQFHQLIGYSVSGAPLSPDTRAIVDQMESGATDERDAELRALRATLAEARKGMRAGVAALFEIHPDNLTE